MGPIAEEEVDESHLGEVQTSQVSEVPLVVRLTVDADEAVDGSSSGVYFSSPSFVPLSMILSDFFFALGPWRYPESGTPSGGYVFFGRGIF